MTKNKLRVWVGIILCLMLPFSIQAQEKEKVFADYFDIQTNSKEGVEVIGRIHLERNKDVLTRPIPQSYCFEILEQDKPGLFRLDTRYDLSKRIMGVFSVANGKQTEAEKAVHRLVVALKDGERQLNKFKVTIRVTKEPLMDRLYRHYLPEVENNSRMYGRMTFSDEEVADKLVELKGNGWKFKGLEKGYSGRPQDYKGKANTSESYNNTGTIEYDWEKIVNQIGGLGHAYANSQLYGPKGDPSKHNELREALYESILTFTNSVPVEGSELMIDGKAIGNCTGDGFALLQAHRLAGMQISTHQWQIVDGLIGPAMHLLPELLEGIRKGDKRCEKVQNSLIRYLQVFFAEIKGRRAIDNPQGRWGELQDTINSAGAWADANLGHRIRTMLALPFIWADYNRPLTYVQYWYKDFYKGKPFKGFSYSTGWSPHGIMSDLSYWMTKYDVVAHKYIQSGFQPDGTVSHHIANATDAAMVAYGFGWLTDCNIGYDYLKNTRYSVPSKYYQFQADRLLNVYPRMFYKQRMDFLVAGRSFLDNLRDFATKTYPRAVNSMLKARSKNTQITGVEELKDVCRNIKENTFEYSGTNAYWVNEFLVHRRGEHEAPFYASLKLKSERTVGAEDFGKKVRRSWHMGYGILPVKVKGDEYSEKVISNFDWHALPGLTEEWRTDPMPMKGGSQGSLPGLNKIAGVTADGITGMGIYHHLTKETYSTATAFKSYHFIEDKIIAMGTGIARVRPGQGEPIVTFVDQTALRSPLTLCVGKEMKTVNPGESVNIVNDINQVVWLHHGGKGYVIFPLKKLQLIVKSGNEINVTDPAIAKGKPGFIIALSHGAVPGSTLDNAYRYIQLPNVSAEQMPRRVAELLKELRFNSIEGTAHSVYSAKDGIRQYAFFKPATIEAGEIKVTSDDVAQFMLRETEDKWIMTASNPMPDGVKQTLTFHLSKPLPAGTYSYRTTGIYPLEGETVTVSAEGKGCKVTVNIPDIRDAAKYNYQSDLYAATPVIVTIPKK